MPERLTHPPTPHSVEDSLAHRRDMYVAHGGLPRHSHTAEHQAVAWEPEKYEFEPTAFTCEHEQRVQRLEETVAELAELVAKLQAEQEIDANVAVWPDDGNVLEDQGVQFGSVVIYGLIPFGPEEYEDADRVGIPTDLLDDADE